MIPLLCALFFVSASASGNMNGDYAVSSVSDIGKCCAPVLLLVWVCTQPLPILSTLSSLYTRCRPIARSRRHGLEVGLRGQRIRVLRRMGARDRHLLLRGVLDRPGMKRRVYIRRVGRWRVTKGSALCRCAVCGARWRVSRKRLTLPSRAPSLTLPNHIAHPLSHYCR